MSSVAEIKKKISQSSPNLSPIENLTKSTQSPQSPQSLTKLLQKIAEVSSTSATASPVNPVTVPNPVVEQLSATSPVSPFDKYKPHNHPKNEPNNPKSHISMYRCTDIPINSSCEIKDDKLVDIKEKTNWFYDSDIKKTGVDISPCNYCWKQDGDEYTKKREAVDNWTETPTTQQGGRLNLTKSEARNLLKQFKYPLNINTNVQVGGNNGKVVGIKNNKLELNVNGNKMSIQLKNIFVENKPLFL